MRHITDRIMMIRPTSFQFNEETASSNAFQTAGNYDNEVIKAKAIEEFDSMVASLRSKGITIEVIQDTVKPRKPDAIFPNNWISFHNDGTVVTYPMSAENRRLERREDIIDTLSEKYKINKRYTFDYYEEEDRFLEGTGSMLFDRVDNIVYACLSPRTDVVLLEKYSVLMGARKIAFRSVDREGKDIYHTNVMMALGVNFCVLCLESIKNEVEKKEILQSLEDTGKLVVDISYDQMEDFAGNMLQVANADGKTFLVLSQTAYDSLTTEQVNVLSGLTNVLPIPIKTIETLGGGSVRCMMAEIFLPVKQ